jgi:hypothetical protein
MNERKLLESDDPRYLAERREQHYRLGEYTGGEATHSPWELVRDRLYGRLRYAIPLGLVLAAIGGAAGYFFGPVKYESQGMIRIVPNITPIMRETAETGVIPFYANFVQTQSTFLTSSRVLERAVQKLNVTELGWEDQQHALTEMQKVSADPDRGSEIIRVRYAAESGHVAQAVVGRLRQDLGISAAGRLDARRAYEEGDVELWFALSAFSDNASLYEQLVRVSGNVEGSALAGKALVSGARRVDAALQRARTSTQTQNAWSSIRVQLAVLDPGYR